MAANIYLGTAPDSWGVWFPEDPVQTPWERFLDELAAAGYEWLELGPAVTCRPARRSSARRPNGGASRFREGQSEERCTVPQRGTATWPRARRVAALVQAMGARSSSTSPRLIADQDGNFVQSPLLEPDDWQRLTDHASELGRIIEGEFGVRIVFHPHADSHVAGPKEVERFLEETDPSSISLCLDTGHISYCGGDNLALIEAFPDRIGYVHIKQVAPRVLAQVQAEDLAFAEAVRRGAMCEPPGGVPAMEPLIAALERLGGDLFAIVEQDMYPCDPGTPLPIARRTRAYLNSCGIGATTDRSTGC